MNRTCLRIANFCVLALSLTGCCTVFGIGKDCPPEGPIDTSISKNLGRILPILTAEQSQWRDNTTLNAPAKTPDEKAVKEFNKQLRAYLNSDNNPKIMVTIPSEVALKYSDIENAWNDSGKDLNVANVLAPWIVRADTKRNPIKCEQSQAFGTDDIVNFALTLADNLFGKLVAEQFFSPAEKYNALIHYTKSDGVVTKVTFRKKELGKVCD